MSNEPKFPNVEVQLTGNDGNAFAIMGAVTVALKNAFRAGELPEVENFAELQKLLNEYRVQSMSGDYDNLLRTACEWVTVS